MSIIFWAYGKFGFRIPEGITEDIEARIVETIETFQQRELSNLMYGYAKMNKQPGEDVFTAWENRTSKVVKEGEKYISKTNLAVLVLASYLEFITLVLRRHFKTRNIPSHNIFRILPGPWLSWAVYHKTICNQ